MLHQAPSARPPGRRGRLALLPLVAALLVVAALPGRAATQDAPLAEGDAQVIAQGLTSPPAERVSWRVVSEEIPLRVDARPSNRMPSATGFVLASDGPVFIADQDTKRRYRLAPGEAEFVPTGANQTWASLGEATGTVYSVELADATIARDEASGDILTVGSSFEILQGDYDLNLIRDVVDGGETAGLAGGEFPVLVFATAGAVDVGSTRSEETVRLGRGEGVVLRGDVSIAGRGDSRSTYVVAVIGDPVTGGQANPTAVPVEETAEPTEEPTREATAKPTRAATEEPTEETRATRTPRPKATATAEPKETPVATPVGASLRVAVRLCRDGMTVADLNPRGCQRAGGDYRLTLVAPDGTELGLDAAAKAAPSFVRWSGLAPGVYALIVGELPAGYVTYSLDGFPCCPFEGGYVVVVPESGTLDGTLYLLQDFPPLPTAAPVVVATEPPAATVAPQAPVAAGDTDGDGISDADELNVYGTSPTLVDSDGDTIPDGVEAYGGNGYRTIPSRPDSDGDGVNDDVEIARGTDPTSRASR